MHNTNTFRRRGNMIVDSKQVHYHYNFQLPMTYSKHDANEIASLMFTPSVSTHYSAMPIVRNRETDFIGLEYNYDEKLEYVSIAMLVLLEHPDINVVYQYVDDEITKIELIDYNGNHFYSPLYPTVMTFFCGVPMRSIFKNGTAYHNTHGPAVIQWPFEALSRYQQESLYDYSNRQPKVDMSCIVTAYYSQYQQFMKHECTKEYWVENISVHSDLVDNDIVDITEFDDAAKFACSMMPVGVDRLW